MILSVLIPCYNEIDNLPRIEAELIPLLRSLLNTTLPDGHTVTTIDLVFVDDGSQDGTADALNALAARAGTTQLTAHLERHSTNRGLGAALRTGFGATRGQIVITTDCDGTYSFAQIPELLRLLTPETDLVTASPYHPEGAVVGVPSHRLLLSRGSSFLYRLLVRWDIHTYTALFRAYRSEIVEQVPFVSDGFLAGTELMVKAMLRGYRVAEYPAILQRRAFGTSKAKIVRTILAHLGFQGTVLLHRLQVREFAAQTLSTAEGRQ